MVKVPLATGFQKPKQRRNRPKHPEVVPLTATRRVRAERMARHRIDEGTSRGDVR